MDEIFQQAVKKNEEMRKTSVPWELDQPWPQSYFTFEHGKKAWESKTPAPAASGPGISKLALYSWNVDFMLPFAKPRMEAALGTLQNLTIRQPSTTAVIIYLQECVESDLATISESPWVREKFHLTDLDNANWASGHYGTTTLVDRRLPVASCFRVHYAKTRMERDAFFVDVPMGAGQDKKIRVCNTHLESLALEPPFRPPQMALAARFMREEGAGLHGAAAAGDFNAIQDFDKALHSDNGLKDAFLELGGAEDSDDGYTWGQQAATVLRDRFGCSRMDKVYFCGGLGLLGFERFGADVQLEDKEQRDQLVGLGFDKPWITDHLGVMAEFSIE